MSQGEEGVTANPPCTCMCLGEEGVTDCQFTLYVYVWVGGGGILGTLENERVKKE